MTEGGGQKGMERAGWGLEDREHSVDMCFCQPGSNGCCIFSLSYCPSESGSEFISSSFAEIKQNSDSSRNCRATDLIPDDSKVSFFHKS